MEPTKQDLYFLCYICLETFNLTMLLSDNMRAKLSLGYLYALPTSWQREVLYPVAVQERCVKNKWVSRRNEFPEVGYKITVKGLELLGFRGPIDELQGKSISLKPIKRKVDLCKE